MMVHAINPVLGKQRQEDLWEYKASLVYTAKSRLAETSQRDPISLHREIRMSNIHTYMFIHTHTYSLYTQILIYIHTHRHKHTDRHTHILRHTHNHIHIYTHTLIYTHI